MGWAWFGLQFVALSQSFSLHFSLNLDIQCTFSTLEPDSSHIHCLFIAHVPETEEFESAKSLNPTSDQDHQDQAKINQDQDRTPSLQSATRNKKHHSQIHILNTMSRGSPSPFGPPLSAPEAATPSTQGTSFATNAVFPSPTIFSTGFLLPVSEIYYS